MTDDLVKRLRERTHLRMMTASLPPQPVKDWLCQEAADRIEQLEAALLKITTIDAKKHGKNVVDVANLAPRSYPLQPKEHHMEQNFISQSELSKRWGISPRTLEKWRWQGEGPRFVKIGGLVRYRLEDVEAYEASQEISNDIEPNFPHHQRRINND